MKVLITGGSGFIGRNLAESYGGPFDVHAPTHGELDMTDADAVRQQLVSHRYDLVIHSATQRSNRLLGSSPDMLDCNLRMFFNLTRNRGQFGRMLFLSSGAVYGRSHNRALQHEDDFDEHVPSDDYGFSKYVSAKALGGLDNVFELRLFGVFGPYEDWRVRFISNACCRALYDMSVLIRQNVFFDYLDVADLACIVRRFATKKLEQRHYNICTGRAIDLCTLAAKVVAASGKDLPIEVRQEGLGREYSGNNSRMLNELSGYTFRPIDDSIAALYRWYQERQAAVDPALLRFDES